MSECVCVCVCVCAVHRVSPLESQQRMEVCVCAVQRVSPLGSQQCAPDSVQS